MTPKQLEDLKTCLKKDIELFDAMDMLADAHLSVKSLAAINFLQSELVLVKSERDKFKYVPGVMRCPKCGFQCIKSVINLAAGSITAGNSDPEKCPNGCGPLWRMSWEDYANQHILAAEEAFLESKELRARIEKLQQKLSELQDRLAGLAE